MVVTDEYSVTYITFKKGAVRGNHYHKETTQADTVLSGRLLCKNPQAVGYLNNTLVLLAGNICKHEPGDPHAYEALEDSEMISVCIGKRRGEHYEEDTFRLSEKEKLL